MAAQFNKVCILGVWSTTLSYLANPKITQETVPSDDIFR
jgi:hypothetical protein